MVRAKLAAGKLSIWPAKRGMQHSEFLVINICCGSEKVETSPPWSAVILADHGGGEDMSVSTVTHHTFFNTCILISFSVYMTSY